MKRISPISISLSPNVEKDDLLLAWQILFKPWQWKKGKKSEEIEKEFKKYFNTKYAFSFNSGRSALMAILDSLDFSKGDEILLQAFTCNAVPNPVLWSGLKPVYVDCDKDTFNIDIEDLKRKITPKSRAIIVQHTFGLPAEIDEILEICRQNNLVLIEDCAHALGAEYKNKKIGTFGRAAFFSFSRDKIISSVYGGMVITEDDTLATKISKYQEKLSYPSNFWIFQQLLHPLLINYLVLPTYKVLGKYLLVLFQYLNILSKAVHWKEKRGEKPSYFPKRSSNALSELALNQFKKIEKFSNHRREIAQIYYDKMKETSFELPPDPQDRKQVFLRFTVKHPKAHQIIKQCWHNNILIGDWYTKVIAPQDTNLESIEYKTGVCPKAENLSRETFNLPTSINVSREDAERIVDFLKKLKF